jgi:hypothetical protein
MDKITINNKDQYLSIGTYSIHVSYPESNYGLYYLPDRTEQFLNDNLTKSNKLKINYTIRFENSFIEPEDTPIAGFDDGPFPYRIYQTSFGDYLWIRKDKYDEIQLVYRISNDWSSWKLIIDKSGSLGTYSFAELAYIFAYSVLNKGGVMFHGVVMEWQSMGIIFCAHSKVGKSTHTRMWRDNENALILNGDRALCCKEENSWYTYGAPWCGSSEEYSNRKVPLSVVVILERAEFNEVSVLSPLQGAMELIQLTFAPAWEENLMNCSLDSIDSIVQKVPVLKLKCRPDLEAVGVLKAELQKISLTSR